jgi:signal transduction histidine kinase
MAQKTTQYYLRTADLDSGVIIIDDDLKIYHYNRWLEIQTNIKEKDILHKKLDSVFENIKTKTLIRKVKTALRMNTPTFYTAATSHYLIPIKINQFKNSIYEYMQQDVSIVPYDTEKKLVSLVIKDQTNMAYTNALLNSHIKEIKKLNDALIKEQKLREKQYEQLLASSRSAAMGDMISMIAHQWRQPLSLITTLMANLKIKKELGTMDDISLQNSFDKIEETIHYLSDTVNDFRDYFKPNKIKSPLKLYELFSKSIFFLIDEMEQNGIDYTIKIQKDIEIYTYKNELLQCIINIIKNSIDAFKEKEKLTNKNITVTVEEREDSLLLYLEDNAGGIDKENLQKIFEPYFSTKNKNGTGLGLYMCKTIIEKHLKGTISLTSDTNGTKVAITLPSFL